MVTAEACRSYSFLVSVCLCSESASDAAMQAQLGRWPIKHTGSGDHTQQQPANTAPLPSRGNALGLLSREQGHVFDVGVAGELLCFPIAATIHARQKRNTGFR
ncbi:hypothetical protein K523DRAFT_61778 [Schizophyllum commune Tattone D]|nr:hypothetical protein K523DRAFT_61778 [Schizophyllum commune Tattone D]